MTTESTRFKFEDVGGERIVKRFRDFARGAGAADAAVKSLNRTLRQTRGAGRGGRGGGFGGSALDITASNARIQVQSAKARVEALRVEAQQVKATGQSYASAASQAVAAEKTKREAIKASNRLAVESSKAKNARGLENQRAGNRRTDRTLAAQISRETALYNRLGPTAAAAYAYITRGNRKASQSTLVTLGAIQTLGRGMVRILSGAANSVVRVFRSAFRSLSRIITSPLAILAGGVGIAFGLRTLARYSDIYLNTANRIAASNDAAAKSTKLLAKTQAELFNIANRARSPIEGLSELYGRLALGARGARIAQKELLTITEAVGKAAAISGGSAQSTEGALIQLSQILGASGSARGIGQELRSIREQAPYLFTTIAEGLKRTGVSASGTTGELEKLAEEGRLTSEQVAKAILSMADDVEDRFKRITPTISQAFTVLRNSAIKFVGVFSNSTGAGESFSRMIIELADTLDRSSERFARRVQGVLDIARTALLLEPPGNNASQKDRDTYRQRVTSANQDIQRIGRALSGAAITILETVVTVLLKTAKSAGEIIASALADTLTKRISDSPATKTLNAASIFSKGLITRYLGIRRFFPQKKDDAVASDQFDPRTQAAKSVQGLLAATKELGKNLKKVFEDTTYEIDAAIGPAKKLESTTGNFLSSIANAAKSARSNLLNLRSEFARANEESALFASDLSSKTSANKLTADILRAVGRGEQAGQFDRRADRATLAIDRRNQRDKLGLDVDKEYGGSSPGVKDKVLADRNQALSDLFAREDTATAIETLSDRLGRLRDRLDEARYSAGRLADARELSPFQTGFAQNYQERSRNASVDPVVGAIQKAQGELLRTLENLPAGVGREVAENLQSIGINIGIIDEAEVN